MCGCRDVCRVARCVGCPGTDWNSFTWRVDMPASVGSLIWGTIERKFAATSQAMIYPGTCSCLWLNYLGDTGRDISGAYNASTAFHPIASVSSLRYMRAGYQYRWRFSIVRYGWDWGYWNGLGWDPDTGWNWGAYGPYGSGENDCTYAWGAGWGFGRWGYGAWGGGYGYGFDPAYWYVDYGFAADYQLVGTFDCLGTNRFERVDATYAEQEEYDADSWPAYVEVTRIQRNRLQELVI